MAVALTNSYFSLNQPEYTVEDLKRFEQLFHQYQEPLRHFAVKFVDSIEAAEEIVLDVFLKIWKNKDTLIIKTSLQAYLFRAVRNQSIDYLRKTMRFSILPEENCFDLPSNYDSPEECAMLEELEFLIEAAINTLPPQGRTIFRLSRDNGMKYQEIANYLKISIKTVETHMGRSLKHLREILQEQNAF